VSGCEDGVSGWKNGVGRRKNGVGGRESSIRGRENGFESSFDANVRIELAAIFTQNCEGLSGVELT
jgi:hypothetical protein